MSKVGEQARLDTIKYLTKITNQFWHSLCTRDEKLWQFLSPHCRMQNKFGGGGRGVNGLVPCLLKLGEVQTELLESEPYEMKEVVKVVSNAMVCLLVTVHSALSDWSLGFSIYWEWGRIVGIVFMHSVDADSFIANVVKRHAITLKQGPFTSIDEAKFEWHKKSKVRSLYGVVLSAAECKSLLDQPTANYSETDLSLLSSGQEQVFIPASDTANCFTKNSLPNRKESNECNTLDVDSVRLSDSKEGAVLKNAFAKYHTAEKKKVRFATALVSYILVPRVSIKHSTSPLYNREHELLFYTSLDFMRFLEESDREVAHKINSVYKLTKRMLSVREAKELLFQPDGVVLYSNSNHGHTLDEVPLYEGVSPDEGSDGHNMDALCSAIRERTSSKMVDKVDRDTVHKKYGVNEYDTCESNEQEQRIADIIIPQSKNNSWYVSKYARRAYRKLTHKKIDIGGGIASPAPLVALRHGEHIILASVVATPGEKTNISDNCGQQQTEITEKGMFFDVVRNGDVLSDHHIHHHVHRNRVAYASYMLGSRVQPPFFNPRPPGGDITKLYITVIGCRNLKSPFVRLIPRPVNAFVEVQIGDQKLRTETKQTDLNPLYDSNTTFLFELHDIYMDELRFDNGVIQLKVSDSCFSVTKIGAAWIPFSSIGFSADSSDPTLLTLPIITGEKPTYFSVRQTTEGVTLPPVATTSRTALGRTHNDMLIEHAQAENQAHGLPGPTVSVLISKVNPVMFWMLEELRAHDEEKDRAILLKSECQGRTLSEPNDINSGDNCFCYEFESWLHRDTPALPLS